MKKQKNQTKRMKATGTPVTSVKGPSGWKKAKKPSGKFFKFTEYGQTLEGVFKGIVPSKKKNFSDSLSVETSEGVIMTPLSFDLQQIFENNGIKEGQRVHIVFVDAIPLKGNRSMKKFEVFFK